MNPGPYFQIASHALRRVESLQKMFDLEKTKYEIYSAASVRAAENLVDEIEYRSARGDAVRVGHSHAWGK